MSDFYVKGLPPKIVCSSLEIILGPLDLNIFSLILRLLLQKEINYLQTFS